jgi:RNA polymerase sigma-70 factor (sigma-E family)
VRRADEDDYREYVAARMERLRRTAYLLCHDWHVADDVVSVTLGRLYRHWGRARRVERLDAYVGRMLVNAWHDEGRRAARETPTAELPAGAGRPGPDVAERLSQLELLRRLPPRRRAAVVLRFYYDLSVQETAGALGCSEGTVKSLTSRGLESLRALTVLADVTEDR